MNDLIRRDLLEVSGKAANEIAAAYALKEYRLLKSDRTLRAQDNDLVLFSRFLENSVNIDALNLSEDVGDWRGISYGHVKGFVHWMVNQGYALSSVNRALSTIKTYAKIAFQNGAIDHEAHSLIRTVTGYSQKEARRIDERREQTSIMDIRPTVLAEADIRALKTEHENTPQGRRDRLMMCILLDLGVRVGELVRMEVSGVDLKRGAIIFYRPKVDKTQTHNLPGDTLKAMRAYFQMADAPAVGPILRGSLKNSELTHAGITEDGVYKRIKQLGWDILQLDTLSPHDCRHAWATLAAQHKTDPFALQEAGGWNSLAMPRRYIEAAKISNEGVNLS